MNKSDIVFIGPNHKNDNNIDVIPDSKSRKKIDIKIIIKKVFYSSAIWRMTYKFIRNILVLLILVMTLMNLVLLYNGKLAINVKGNNKHGVIPIAGNIGIGGGIDVNNY